MKEKKWGEREKKGARARVKEPWRRLGGCVKI